MALKAVGIDLNSAADQAVPAIVSQIDNALADIAVADNESKGIVIVADGQGSYYLVKTIFDNEASKHMQNKGYEKVENLVKSIINSIL